ncbi:hypothetical protein [Oribacterium parvum]|uniref:hypothetical protein n=1 Tax=Oribacterium parvum TaxID=1501329 RepID=UPI0028E8BAC4|nr:hypothetical protein [Oribacterium parvum]
MKFILNDLSYHKDVTNCNVTKVRDSINTFIELLLELAKENVLKDKGDIACFVKPVDIDFGCDFNLRDYLKETNNDCRRLFYRFIEKYVGDVFNTSDSEFSCIINNNNYTSKILHKVIEEDCNALSFSICDFFCHDNIKGKYIICDEELNDTREEDKIIPNLYIRTQITNFKAECKNDEYEKILSAYDFWENRNGLFPHLEFCESVRQQLYDNPGKQHIKSIMKRLEILNEYYDKNDKFNITNLGHKARDESQTVKNNSKYKEFRKFKKPNGSTSYFFKHISFSGDFQGRIYFEAEDTLKKICIGYIGPHLPTAKF